MIIFFILVLKKKTIYRVFFFFQWGDFSFVLLMLLWNSAVNEVHCSRRVQSSFQQIHTEPLVCLALYQALGLPWWPKGACCPKGKKQEAHHFRTTREI